MQDKSQTKQLVFWLTYLIFFAVLNETVFNVSIPKIAEEFQLNAATVSWVMTIFMVFFGIGSVIYGKLADLFSLRRLIEIGTWIYCVASVLGFVAQHNYWLVVVARGLQAMGASAIPALIFVVIARYVPEAGRGKVFGFITSMISVSIGIGPVIGGFVSAHWHWSMLFVIPLPTLIALPYLRRYIPEETSRPGTVDVIGALLVSLTVGLLVLCLNLMLKGLMVALLISSVVMVVWMLKASNPFIDAKVFANRRFCNGIFVGMTMFSVVMGVFFLIPLMLTDVHGLGTEQIGYLLFPGAISAVFMGPKAGEIADKKGNAYVASIGVLLLAGSMLLMSALFALNYWVVLVAMLGNYVGFTMFQTAMINSVSQTLEPEQSGIGMGIFNLISIVSGALGTTLVGRTLDGRWLHTGLLSFSGNALSFVYSDILALLAVIVLASGWVFHFTFSAKQTAFSQPSH